MRLAEVSGDGGPRLRVSRIRHVGMAAGSGRLDDLFEMILEKKGGIDVRVSEAEIVDPVGAKLLPQADTFLEHLPDPG